MSGAAASDSAAGARPFLIALGHPRRLGRGRAQLLGVALAFVVLALLGVGEARTPPNVTFGGLLLLVVLASTWLFSVWASLLVTAAAVCVPLVAYGVGADDLVAAEVEILAVVVLSAGVHLAIRAIAQYEDLLARRNRELRDVNASLERFTSDAAHEFRAPLAVVMSEVEIALARAESAAEYRRHLDVIGAEVAGMRRTITGLLTLARADAGVLQAAFRCVDIVDLLQVVVTRWQQLFERRHATLESSLPEDGEIFCDPDLLVRVIDNLLDNALRAVSSGGVVELTVQRDVDDWLFTVRDSGPGIDPDAAATLMDPRAQPLMPRSRGNAGTGFGLALCAAIVKAHQGSIRAERSTNGAVLTVRLPVDARPSHAG